jgi:hypothetical protein
VAGCQQPNRRTAITTIAWDGRSIAADSQITYESEAGGTRKHKCGNKLHRKTVLVDGDSEEVIIAIQGEASPANVFVEWFDGTKKDPPEIFAYNPPDFTCLVWFKHGLYEYDAYCVGEQVTEPFYAIGSGAKAALGALHKGAHALEAVQIAALVDPYTSGPFHVETLEGNN